MGSSQYNHYKAALYQTTRSTTFTRALDPTTFTRHNPLQAWLPGALMTRELVCLWQEVEQQYIKYMEQSWQYLKGVVRDFGHRTLFPSEPVCYLSLATLRATKGWSAESQLFSVLGPQWWNELPADVRTTESLTSIRKRLKTHLFRVHLDSIPPFSPLFVCFAIVCCTSWHLMNTLNPRCIHSLYLIV